MSRLIALAQVEQLHKIFKLCGSPPEEYWRRAKLSHATVLKPQNQYRQRVAETFKDFPVSALSILESLLAIEPDARGTASSALQSDYFKSEPLACDRSSLPKFPPSKEYDAKLSDQKTRWLNRGLKLLKLIAQCSQLWLMHPKLRAPTVEERGKRYNQGLT